MSNVSLEDCSLKELLEKQKELLVKQKETLFKLESEELETPSIKDYIAEMRAEIKAEEIYIGKTESGRDDELIILNLTMQKWDSDTKKPFDKELFLRFGIFAWEEQKTINSTIEKLHTYLWDDIFQNFSYDSNKHKKTHVKAWNAHYFDLDLEEKIILSFTSELYDQCSWARHKSHILKILEGLYLDGLTLTQDTKPGFLVSQNELIILNKKMRENRNYFLLRELNLSKKNTHKAFSYDLKTLYEFLEIEETPDTNIFEDVIPNYEIFDHFSKLSKPKYLKGKTRRGIWIIINQ